MSTYEIWKLLAQVFVPVLTAIIAVFVDRKLNEKSSKKREILNKKNHIFDDLMKHRFLSIEKPLIDAIALIPIYFVDSREIMSALDCLIKTVSEKTSKDFIKNAQKARQALIKAVAKELNIDIQDNVFHQVYRPQIYGDHEQNIINFYKFGAEIFQGRPLMVVDLANQNQHVVTAIEKTHHAKIKNLSCTSSWEEVCKYADSNDISRKKAEFIYKNREVNDIDEVISKNFK